MYNNSCINGETKKVVSMNYEMLFLQNNNFFYSIQILGLLSLLINKWISFYLLFFFFVYYYCFCLVLLHRFVKALLYAAMSGFDLGVITHSLCAICVWILWWFRTLCSWEHITRWMILKNLVLKNAETQCSHRMWH